MALRAIKDWTDWLSDLPLSAEDITKYAKELTTAELTEDDLTDLTHEILDRMNISKPGHQIKILKKARLTITQTTSIESSPTIRKSDIKLPNIAKCCSPSQFRKFLIDWSIYKSESHLVGPQCNKLLYCACDEALQTTIINGMPEFLNSSEDKLIEFIKHTVTQLSNPTVY